MDKLILIAIINIIPGFEEEVKKATVALAIETRKETGCELFLINTRNDSPQTIVFYEVYQSREVFQEHLARPYTRGFMEFAKGRIENDKPEIIFLTAMDS
jgi:quinol monooxygenase YgiN